MWRAATADHRRGSHDDRRHAKWRPSSTSLPAPIARHANDHCASRSWWWRRRRNACTFCERWSIGVRGTRRSPRGRPRPSRRATCHGYDRPDGAFTTGTLTLYALSPLRDTGVRVSLSCPVAWYWRRQTLFKGRSTCNKCLERRHSSHVSLLRSRLLHVQPLSLIHSIFRVRSVDGWRLVFEIRGYSAVVSGENRENEGYLANDASK